MLQAVAASAAAMWAPAAVLASIATFVENEAGYDVTEEVKTDWHNLLSGDVLMFHGLKVGNHVGIVLDAPFFWHSLLRYGVQQNTLADNLRQADEDSGYFGMVGLYRRGVDRIPSHLRSLILRRASLSL